MSRVPLAIFGMGNVLCGDDGLGVQAIARLARCYELPPGVRVFDGGTLGLSLLPYLRESDAAILIDAIAADAPPGTLVRLEREAARPVLRDRISPHQIGVADVVGALDALEDGPREVVLLGMVPECVEQFRDLSPTVVERIPELVACVAEEACRLGFAVRERLLAPPVLRLLPGHVRRAAGAARLQP